MWKLNRKRNTTFGAGGLTCLIALCWLATSAASDKSVHSSPSRHPPTDSTPISLSTLDRLEDMPWWPTKGTTSRGDYVGTAQCTQCHFAKVTSQLSTEMAHASTRFVDPATLDAQTTFSFRQTPYSYEIGRNGDGVFESVSDGNSSISHPLLFAFGKGTVGHTYIYRANGRLFESRLSYYSSLNGLDLTTGHARSVPPDLDHASGLLLAPDEAQKCFGCHTTASTTANHFDADGSVSGVTCEACHGPGSQHVAAMKRGQIARGKRLILNPASLDPASAVDFCGACHRTFGDVIQMSVKGVATVRFQPFRLEESACWSHSKGQFTCVTCHDPHQPLVHDIASYDQICLGCHSQSLGRKPQEGSFGVCKVSKVNCVSCHMPKVEIPGMHHAFTDHWIRVSTSGAAYPN